MTDTQELLKRLEGGGDWLYEELNDLTRSLCGTSYTVHDWGLVAEAVKDGSLDAAVALVERVRPGWDWLVSKNEDICLAGIESPENPVGMIGVQGRAPTPAAALLAALLKAEG